MKKVMAVAVASVFLVACSEKNEAYYLDNIGKAEQKMESCNEAARKAFMSGKTSELDRLNKDAECNAASSAIKTHKRMQYELEKKQAEERHAQAVKTARDAINESLKDQTWQKQIAAYLGSECVNAFSFNKTPECTAWDEVYESAVTQGKAQMQSVTYLDLKGEEKTYCGEDKRPKSACTVWQNVVGEKATEVLQPMDIFELYTKKGDFCHAEGYDASSSCKAWEGLYRERSQALTQHFVNDFDAFKTAYNQCYVKMQAVRDLGLSYFDQDEQFRPILHSVPCAQANQAYRDRRLGYSDFKAPIE